MLPGRGSESLVQWIWIEFEWQVATSCQNTPGLAPEVSVMGRHHRVHDMRVNQADLLILSDTDGHVLIYYFLLLFPAGDIKDVG